MELLFVALGGALLGLAARYSMPGRGAHGAVLIPAIGTAVASVVWVALTWLGLKWDGGWIWWITFAVAGAASVGADILLRRRRSRADQEMLQTLIKRGTPQRT